MNGSILKSGKECFQIAGERVSSFAVAHMGGWTESQPLSAFPVFQIVPALKSGFREIADLILMISCPAHLLAECPVAICLDVI